MQSPHGRDGDTENPLPDAESALGVADFLDDCRNFMAKDHRLFQPNGTESAVLVVVKIRAADTAASNANTQLAGRQRQRFVTGLDTQVFRGMADNRLHGHSPDYSDAVMAPST